MIEAVRVNNILVKYNMTFTSFSCFNSSWIQHVYLIFVQILRQHFFCWQQRALTAATSGQTAPRSTENTRPTPWSWSTSPRLVDQSTTMSNWASHWRRWAWRWWSASQQVRSQIQQPWNQTSSTRLLWKTTCQFTGSCSQWRSSTAWSHWPTRGRTSCCPQLVGQQECQPSTRWSSTCLRSWRQRPLSIIRQKVIAQQLRQHSGSSWAFKKIINRTNFDWQMVQSPSSTEDMWHRRCSFHGIEHFDSTTMSSAPNSPGWSQRHLRQQVSCGQSTIASRGSTTSCGPSTCLLMPARWSTQVPMNGHRSCKPWPTQAYRLWTTSMTMSTRGSKGFWHSRTLWSNRDQCSTRATSIGMEPKQWSAWEATLLWCRSSTSSTTQSMPNRSTLGEPNAMLETTWISTKRALQPTRMATICLDDSTWQRSQLMMTSTKGWNCNILGQHPKQQRCWWCRTPTSLERMTSNSDQQVYTTCHVVDNIFDQHSMM